MKIMEFLASLKIKFKLFCMTAFCRIRLDVLFSPLDYFLHNLVYLTKFSKWISQHEGKRTKPKINHRFDLYDLIYSTEYLNQEVDYLEFGVASGSSIKWWVEKNKNLNSRFIGFDTFEGLCDPWGPYPKGMFSTQGKEPDVNDNRVKFIKGFFQDTLYKVLPDLNLNRRTIIHLDADLYSSTIYVLLTLVQKFKRGDLIIFDEFGSPLHEFRAFMDFLDVTRYDYEVIGEMENFGVLVVKLGDVRR